MTVKIPKPNFFDKLLNFLGKKRGVIVPTNAYEKYGQYVYASCQRESFWKALFRPKGSNLPDDTADIYSLQPTFRKDFGKTPILRGLSAI